MTYSSKKLIEISCPKQTYSIPSSGRAAVLKGSPYLWPVSMAWASDTSSSAVSIIYNCIRYHDCQLGRIPDQNPVYTLLPRVSFLCMLPRYIQIDDPKPPAEGISTLLSKVDQSRGY